MNVEFRKEVPKIIYGRDLGSGGRESAARIKGTVSDCGEVLHIYVIFGCYLGYAYLTHVILTEFDKSTCFQLLRRSFTCIPFFIKNKAIRMTNYD